MRGWLDHCAINATGGYKAPVAISVLIRQALGVPIYYSMNCLARLLHFRQCQLVWIMHCG
ncbi:MAG: hypothetical protein IPK63_08425 [Candidatus Competibacteraceae bacterium]|nr:hypothetical protein [Candidatus Competibacteraceae bacterium]